MKLSTVDYKKLAYITVCAIGGALALYVMLKYLLWVVLPFLIAWGMSFPVRKCAVYVSQRTRLPIKVASFLLVLLFVGGVLTVVGLIISRLAAELRQLILYISANPNIIYEITESVKGFLEKIIGYFPIVSRSGVGEAHSIEEYLTTFISESTSTVISAMPSVIGGIAVRLPKILFFIVVCVVATFYFSLDLTRINQSVLGLFPKRVQERIMSMKSGVLRIMLKYLRAYLTLMLLIFSILLVGLLMLRVRYAFLLALIFAVVDLLPMFGVGLMLIPWALFSLLTHNTALGIGLLVLYGVIAVVRQYAEPRIVGAHFGIHPLLTLFAMYAGVSLFGFFGVLIGPPLAIAVKSLVFTDKSENYRKNILP